MELSLNQAPSTVMHIDLNSCFASIEQQANPLLRGKPVAVAAYPTDGGCILAASYEAKKLGVKTGLRVREGKALCPELIVLPPDPPKYRFVSRKLMDLFCQYSPDCVPKSVDEAVLNFFGTKSFTRGLWEVGREIKTRIKEEVGDWLRVNVGIAPNCFLAKTAASWHKPDGLDEINHQNLHQALGEFSLVDLCGINVRYQARLNAVGIFTPLDFLDAPLLTLRQAFGGIGGYYWYLRLRGWEIDDVSFPRRSFGQSYALPRPTADPRELSRLLCKLCEKMGRRLREASFQAFGIHVTCLYGHHDFWHHGEKGRTALYST
ncbi:MAG: DNA polymerase IV, partial [bacterium]|nr:DNA polymerase IV [bacterium]